MAEHRKPRRYIGYHLMVAALLGGVAFTAACTDDPAPAPKPALEVVTPQPEPTPVPPAEVDPAPAEPVEVAAVTPEPDEDEQGEIPVNAGTDRGIYGPEDCDTANTTTPMTQAEWAANCSDWDNSVTTPEEEDLPGYDYWPEGEDVACQGYGCSPEQDALLDEAEAAANAGY
jgi:hypothetical protein